MWFISPEGTAESNDEVVWVFNLCCGSGGLQGSEALLQSRGPLALGGWSSARGPLGFLHLGQGAMLHLHSPSSAEASLAIWASWGGSGTPQGLERGWGEVLPSAAWLFLSSDVTHVLFLSHSGGRSVGVAERTFWLMDRCLMMLHCRAMMSCSHCGKQHKQFKCFQQTKQ